MTVFRVLIVSALLAIGLLGCSPPIGKQSEVLALNSVVFYSELGGSIQAVYSDEGYVQLTFDDGRSLVLQQVVSGSGARYQGHSAEWWEHHGEAVYKVNGQIVFTGKLQH